MKAIAKVRRIEMTPARTRTRLAKALMCSFFSLRNPDLIVCATVCGAHPFHSCGYDDEHPPPRLREPERIGEGRHGRHQPADHSPPRRGGAVKGPRRRDARGRGG